MKQIYFSISNRNIGELFQEMNKQLKMYLLGLELITYINTRFFYKQHFYKQYQTEIGKKLSKS